MAFRLGAVRYQEVNAQFGRILTAFKPPEMAEIMLRGAEEIAEETRDNILRQELVDEGNLYDSVEAQKINQYSAGVKVGVVHAAVHEFGLENQPITEKQRRFFWAMFAETGDDMWKALALSDTYTIPARPYLRPAVDSKKQAALYAIMREAASRLTRAVGIGR